MLATVHLADLGPLGTVKTTARRLDRTAVPGLRWGSTAMAVPLAASGPPPFSRTALIGFWDDAAAVDAFLADHLLGRRFAGGVDVRLEPLRAHGAWPGFPDDVPTARNVPHDGPVAVLTLSQLRMSQIGRFVQTSQRAERTAVVDPGLRWMTGALRLPFAATISFWADTRSVVSWAYSRQRPEHPDAIVEGDRKSFNTRSLFARLAPVSVSGKVDGANPLDAVAALAPLVPGSAPTQTG